MSDVDELVRKAIADAGLTDMVEAARVRQANLTEQAVAARDWSGALQFTSSFDRFDKFLEIAPLMTADELRACLPDVWTGCDGCIWPNRRSAVHYLRKAGYVGDLPQPTEPPTLYRGVFASAHRRGLSWSTSIDIARHFVRPRGRGPNQGGFVFRVVAPTAAILAGFNDRDEAEYVLDPGMLAPRSIRRYEIVKSEL
jgi:hypothetical protein